LLIETGVGFPCAAELESNFGDKVIGFAGTEHHILIPTLSVLSLAEKTVKPVPEGTAPLTEDQAKALLRKVNPNPPSQHFWEIVLASPHALLTCRRKSKMTPLLLPRV
jgi:hypothetical protein